MGLTVVKRGLTLLETIVALGFLAVIIVSMAALFIRLLRSSDQSGDRQAGIQVAEQVLQEMISTQNFDLAPDDHKLLAYTHDASNPTEFIYRITSTPIILSPGANPTSIASYDVDIRVSWFGQVSTGSSGSTRGKLQAQLRRLVTP